MIFPFEIDVQPVVQLLDDPLVGVRNMVPRCVTKVTNNAAGDNQEEVKTRLIEREKKENKMKKRKRLGNSV